jgi:hypothetical protein
VVAANAKVEMNQILAQIDISNRAVLLLFGLALFAVGILLMIQHRREWDSVRRSERIARNLKFEHKKFRRRALVGSLLSLVGAVMASLYWAHDSTVFVAMTIAMFLVLILMLSLGVVDLLAVSLHQFSTVDDKAKKEMVRKALELHEARKKEAGTPSSPNETADEAKPVS